MTNKSPFTATAKAIAPTTSWKINHGKLGPNIGNHSNIWNPIPAADGNTGLWNSKSRGNGEQGGGNDDPPTPIITNGKNQTNNKEKAEKGKNESQTAIFHAIEGEATPELKTRMEEKVPEGPYEASWQGQYVATQKQFRSMEITLATEYAYMHKSRPTWMTKRMIAGIAQFIKTEHLWKGNVITVDGGDIHPLIEMTKQCAEKKAMRALTKEDVSLMCAPELFSVDIEGELKKEGKPKKNKMKTAIKEWIEMMYEGDFDSAMVALLNVKDRKQLTQLVTVPGKIEKFIAKTAPSACFAPPVLYTNVRIH